MSVNLYWETDIYKISKLMETLFDMRKQSSKYTYTVNPKESHVIQEVSCGKKEKKRRVTPVPNDINIVKTSSLLRRKKLSKTYLSVEEEDDDDLENYQQESDYVSPDIIGKTEFNKKYRSSWHGETFQTEVSRQRRRAAGLTKTKSVDRGTDYKRRTRKISVVNNDLCNITNMTENLDIKQKNSTMEENCELPLWMQNAKNEMTNQQTAKPKPEKKNSIKEHLCEIETKQLKEKQFFSNRRKELLKQKTLEEKRKHRKITPSKLHSFSFDKFHELRNSSKKYQVTEEEEEPEE